MAKSAPTSPTSPTSPPQALDFSRLVSHTEMAEGSGSFGPTSFRGTIIEAGYCPHRFMSDPPKPDQNPAYFAILWAKFRVDEVLDSESGWDPDDHDNVFEHTGWKLGGKSLQYLFATNDAETPAGISGGFEELALMAAGRTDRGEMVTFTDPIEATRGRWIMAIPGVPENKTKLEPKSGYAIFLRESVPAVEAVDPSLVVSWQNKKGETEKNLNVNMLGEDGYPLGARFFVGLSGVWDTKTLQLDIKGGKVTQKVLYLTSFDGRVDVGEEGEMQTPAQAPSTTTTTATTTKKTGTATTATTKNAAAQTPAQTAATSTTTETGDASGEDEPQDMQSKITRLILSTLPVSGHVSEIDLAKQVGPQLTKVFLPGELPKAVEVYKATVKAAPDKAGAQSMSDMGMAPMFTYDATSQRVERWQAQ
jgi:hypothetical protein